MSSILIFDGDCVACDRVARELIGVQGIELVAASSSRGAQLMNSTSGVSAPCLIEVDEQGGFVKARQGWAMRAAIARKVGWRHMGRWYPLLKSEVTARQARGSLVSRRTTLAGLGLGVVATVMGIPKPAVAAAPTADVVLDADEQIRLFSGKSPRLQQALRTWGPATEARQFKRGEAVAVGFLHGTTRVVTYVISDRPEIAYSLRSSTEGLEVLKPDGSSVGTISAVTSASGAQSVVTTRAAGTQAGATPDSIPDFTECFIGCMGWYVSLPCILSCATNPAMCWCAGWPGLACALTCAPYIP
jgi:predicted DCC family thiol-disulfide oxidoreductase YuxK